MDLSDINRDYIKYKMKQNEFCKALSNAVSFRVPGDSNTLTWNPCCLYDDYLPYFVPAFNKQRQEFINADKEYLPGCSKCKLKENTHGYKNTQRGKFNEELLFADDDTIAKLEIVLDTTCNAACIQCGTYQSSLWRNEYAKRDPKFIHIQPESQIDNKIEIIKKNVDLQKVKIFHFWGGEPLLTDTHLKFLREIENPEEVKIQYTTNASIFPDDETLKLWSRFREVKIGLSIDGIDDQFHYIRWPLKWNKVVNVLKNIKDNSPYNTLFHINSCALPLNVLYTQRLGEWASENFSLDYYQRKINLNYIRGEGFLDIALTPMNLRDEVWKKLGEDHVVSKILKEVEIKDYSDMIGYLDHWDPIRKLDWRTTFPELVKYFK